MVSPATPDSVAVHAQQALRDVNADLARRLKVHTMLIRPADNVALREEGGATRNVAFWFVPVLIDPQETSMYRVYELFNEAEDLLLSKYGEHVLLVPAVLGVSKS